LARFIDHNVFKGTGHSGVACGARIGDGAFGGDTRIKWAMRNHLAQRPEARFRAPRDG
jgi:hypothetical protein